MSNNRTRYFQWVDGELKGSITTLESIYEMDGEYFYQLADGEACNLRCISPMTDDPTMLKNKFLVEILSPAYAWKVETIGIRKEKVLDDDNGEITVDVPPLEDFLKGDGTTEVQIMDSAVGKVRLLPPVKCPTRYDLPNIEDYIQKDPEIIIEQRAEIIKTESNITPVASNNINVSQDIKTQNNAVKSQNTIDISDPVYVLTNNCKKHPTNISMTLTINLPNKSIYGIAEDEFENGGDKFIDYLIKEIDTDIIIDALRSSLKSAYSLKTVDK